MADLNNELDLNVPAAPSLTLDAAPAAPTLTLDPAADEKVIAESKKATPVQVEDTPLSPEEQKMVNDFAEKIDNFMENEAPVKAIIFDYYFNFIPYFATLFAPLFVFISVIFFWKYSGTR